MLNGCRQDVFWMMPWEFLCTTKLLVMLMMWWWWWWQRWLWRWWRSLEGNEAAKSSKLLRQGFPVESLPAINLSQPGWSRPRNSKALLKKSINQFGQIHVTTLPALNLSQTGWSRPRNPKQEKCRKSGVVSIKQCVPIKDREAVILPL